jgi:hypothetical protein
MNHIVSIKNTNGELEKVNVEYSVYRYIKQLEYAIKYPIRSKIEELYPDRFGDTKGTE